MEPFGHGLIDSLDDAVVVTDTALSVLAWNLAMERLTGVGRAEALGRPAEDLLAVLCDAGLRPLLLRARAGEAAAIDAECALPGGRGQAWIEARYRPWLDGAGRVAGVVGIHRDVSERRRRATFVRAVGAVGHSLASTLDLNEVLDTIADKALEVMGAESALVVSWDGVAPEFTVLRAAGRLSREYTAAGVIPVGGGPISRTILHAAAVCTPNILTDAETWLVAERRSQIEREGFKAVAAAPLRSKGRVHGALVVHYWTERAFAEEEIGALRWLAEQAALAIDNARVYADATRRAEQLRELAEVEQLVSESLVVDDVLRRIAHATARLLNAPSVQLWTAEPSERRLHLQASYVEPGSADVRIRATVAFGEGVAGRVAEAKAPIYVDDVARDARALSAEWARETGIQRMLSVPILNGEDLLGVLAVRSRTGELGTEENRALVVSLAARAAVALQNARSFADAVRRAARLRDLVAVSRSISASLDAGDVMTRIVQAAAGLRPGALSAVHVFDESRTRLRAAAVSGPEWADLPLERAAAGGLPGLVVERHEPVLIPQPLQHSRTLMRAWWERRPRATYYGVPIDAGDTFVGVLDYVLPEGLPDPEEQEALRLLAAQAGVAIRNAHLYRGAQRGRDVAEVLARLGRELTGTLEVERIAELVSRGLVDLMGVQGAAVSRYEAEDGTLHELASAGPVALMVKGAALQPGEGVAGRAVAEGQVIVTPDALRESHIELTPEVRERLAAAGVTALVGVPLMIRERIIGALALADRTGREFGADELQPLQAFADQAALAFENARLYAAAQDSLTRLRDTQAQLVQAAKMSALGQLVSGVAHELNNPLSVIIGYGQLLLSRDTPPAMRRPIELMVAQGDRMAKIVRNLLFFARQRPAERAAVNLHVVLEQTLALRTSQLALSGVKVETDFAPDLPEITGDSQQLEQVFLNLLLNAEQAILEARPQGRILVRTRVSPDRAFVYADVIDDGPGVPPDVLPRVFEPFFTTKMVGSGTGLGLSVSYGILEEHGGKLSVQSRPGETTFTVELAVSGKREQAPPPSQPRAMPPGEGRRALVVEDEPVVRDLIVALLKEHGWGVDVAGGGRKALQRVARQAYDLIISDMRMPDGDGPDFYRHVQAHTPGLAGRFVFITGDTANPDAWAFLEESGVPVIEKPFPPSVFEDAVARVMSPAP
ncbi:MAG TPA: GAF domain-containing protein [Methylomirabilota bacterium]|nr:GAF domain-containing protein [Methylomirabilota bacterium]